MDPQRLIEKHWNEIRELIEQIIKQNDIDLIENIGEEYAKIVNQVVSTVLNVDSDDSIEKMFRKKYIQNLHQLLKLF